MLCIAAIMTVVYFFAIHRQSANSSGLFRVWPSNRLEVSVDGVTLAESARAERLGGGILFSISWACYFSVLSAFYIGWRELNLGTWITRLQGSDYQLTANGWVRVVSGAQSMASVYLLAIGILTYFGRPFG